MRVPPPPTHSLLRINFRCPSCMQVLSVDLRLAGTKAPCPMCRALIVAPAHHPNLPPFASFADAQTHTNNNPQQADSMPPNSRPSGTTGKVVLADAGINLMHKERKDTVATLKMVIFAVITLGICLAAALLLLAK